MKSTVKLVSAEGFEFIIDYKVFMLENNAQLIMMPFEV